MPGEKKPFYQELADKTGKRVLACKVRLIWKGIVQPSPAGPGKDEDGNEWVEIMSTSVKSASIVCSLALTILASSGCHGGARGTAAQSTAWPRLRVLVEPRSDGTDVLASLDYLEANPKTDVVYPLYFPLSMTSMPDRISHGIIKVITGFEARSGLLICGLRGPNRACYTRIVEGLPYPERLCDGYVGGYGIIMYRLASDTAAGQIPRNPMEPLGLLAIDLTPDRQQLDVALMLEDGDREWQEALYEWTGDLHKRTRLRLEDAEADRTLLICDRALRVSSYASGRYRPVFLCGSFKKKVAPAVEYVAEELAAHIQINGAIEHPYGTRGVVWVWAQPMNMGRFVAFTLLGPKGSCILDSQEVEWGVELLVGEDGKTLVERRALTESEHQDYVARYIMGA